MKKIILNRGIPGSGKSTLADKIFCELELDVKSLICSTDEYWIRPDGVYDWNPKLVKQAHEWNQELFNYCLISEFELVIVDNTNITWKEMKPYVKLALGRGYDIEFQEPDTPWMFDVDELFKRNIHSVPKETIQNMANRYISQQELFDIIDIGLGEELEEKEYSLSLLDNIVRIIQ